MLDAPVVAIPDLSEHVRGIQTNLELMKITGNRLVEFMVDNGRRLQICRESLPHGQWLVWLEEHFQWSDDTARNYINLFNLDKSGKLGGDKFRSVRDLGMPLKSMFYLATPSTPPQAIEAVKTYIEERQEAPTFQQVQAIVKKAKAEIIPPVIKKSSTPATTKSTDAERVETICRRIRDLRVRHLVVRAIKWLIKEYHISTGELE